MATTIVTAAVIIAGFLIGIRLMQSPRTAIWGNRLGALSMVTAITWTFIDTGQGALPTALVYLAIGSVIGLVLGQTVKMIHIPQTVALLNGLGGAASALVAWAALVLGYAGKETIIFLFWGASGLAISIGTLTFSGSIIAVLKLQGLSFRKPVQIKGHGHLLRITIILAFLLVIINMSFLGLYYGWMLPIAALMGLLAGFLMTLRIGGADMPIVISLLNSFSGTAAAIAGLAVNNLILAGTGALVGVAGLILTRIMCQAMNRSLLAVLAGFTPGSRSKMTFSDVDDIGAESEAEKKKIPAANTTDKGERKAKPGLPELLNNAERIIIVPGYGMALAQAQSAVRDLVNALEAQGKEVKLAIHPVAGRMPGHMNVLLAEAGIDYEKLLDMDAVNPQFAQADLVIVIGACDVINPAANSVEGTPISGMPVLNAEQAKNVVVCNMDETPGYSGVENILYEQPHVVKLWGDAAQTIPELTAMVNKKEP